jgi:apolipoprotein N-acyltransferase
MSGARSPALAAAALAGALTVFGFAPFGLAAIPIAALAFLFALWQHAATPRGAAATGFAFGAGLFGAGASWVYVALETFGGMPAALALVATAGFVAYLALWPALAGYACVRLARPGSPLRALAAAGAWTIAEWLRGNVLSGFPWLAVGYAQLPGSPLAGYAPLGGVYLASLAVALVGAMLALAVDALATRGARTIVAAAAGAVALGAGGAALARVEWTRPQGSPLAVSLVQGNIEQDLKFDRNFRAATFDVYLRLVAESRGRLVVLPESAFPMFADEVPDRVYAELARVAQARDGLVLAGLFTAEPPLPGDDEIRYFNTVVALSGGPPQRYRKRHLVPFGETIPAKPVVGWFIRNVLAIPLADQTPGPPDQPPFTVAGRRVAVNICYEDAFGRELIGSARNAGILVNVTNDAWYGRSIAAQQHNQIAAMRALELGRPMLRATNTGVTSAIEVDGTVVAQLPWFTRGVLETTVVARAGATPYQRVGDALVLGAALVPVLVAAVATVVGRRRDIP